VGAAGRGGSASRRGRDLAPSRAFITTDSRSKSRLSERDRPPHRSSRGSRPRSIEDPALFAETIPPPPPGSSTRLALIAISVEFYDPGLRAHLRS